MSYENYENYENYELICHRFIRKYRKHYGNNHLFQKTGSQLNSSNI